MGKQLQLLAKGGVRAGRVDWDEKVILSTNQGPILIVLGESDIYQERDYSKSGSSSSSIMRRKGSSRKPASKDRTE